MAAGGAGVGLAGRGLVDQPAPFMRGGAEALSPRGDASRHMGATLSPL